MEKIEYRVRPVTRYVVTRYREGEGGSCVETRGEYDNADVAYEVGYALCKAEQDQLGWPQGDERVQYPRRIESGQSGGGGPSVASVDGEPLASPNCLPQS